MNLSYEAFEKKARAFCEEKNIGKDELTMMQSRHRFHLEMMGYVKSFYPNDPTSLAQAKKLCENYEGVVWDKYMKEISR